MQRLLIFELGNQFDSSRSQTLSLPLQKHALTILPSCVVVNVKNECTVYIKSHNAICSLFKFG